MKKINMKKLNQFYMSGNNAEEIKTLVNQCVHHFVHDEVKNATAILVLSDLGLLMDAN